jgi:hypothetical protein
MKVNYRLGCTIEIGPYQFIKPEIGVELEGENYERTLEMCQKLVREKMAEELTVIKAAFPNCHYILPYENE